VGVILGVVFKDLVHAVFDVSGCSSSVGVLFRAFVYSLIFIYLFVISDIELRTFLM
jgi:hypothetical protein